MICVFFSYIFSATPTPALSIIQIYVFTKTMTNIVDVDLPDAIATYTNTMQFIYTVDKKGATITAVMNSNLVKPIKTKIANMPKKVKLISIVYMPSPSPTTTPTATPTVLP